jgi:TPR repeat protein
MKTKPLTLILSLTFLFLFSGSVYGGDLQDGLDAYNRKDYKEAVRLFRLSAEQGDAGAQTMLGSMYQQGEGVPQDYKEAVKWYRLSAEQGHALAQHNLGFMYVKGTGVLQDYVSAHMWFNLAGSNGNKNSVHNRDIIEKRMSPTQIEKAQEMARNWKPKK